MPNLTREDIAEIYAALETKIIQIKNGTYGPSIDADLNVEEWVKHLESILDKIGPDGENMTEGPEESRKLYLVPVYGDTDPDIMGPYETDEERDKAARAFRIDEGEDNGIFQLDIVNGAPLIGAYSGGFFEGDDDD